jgi:hypothetical protein
MRNLIGMLIGAAIDREDGDSGIKGAIIGSVAQSAVKLAIPLAITYAVGWGVLHLVRKIIEIDSDDSPIDLTPANASAT